MTITKLFTGRPRVTLLTGPLGSGKTTFIQKRVVETAKGFYEGLNATVDGHILAVTRIGAADTLRRTVDLELPVGSSACTAVTFNSLAETIVMDYGPAVGIHLGKELKTFTFGRPAVYHVHRSLPHLPLGRLRPTIPEESLAQAFTGFVWNLTHYGVEPSDYLSYVEDLEAGLDSRDEVARTESTRDSIGADAWREFVELERDKANAYAAYIKLKDEDRILHATDVLRHSRRILRESALARDALCARFPHVFLDDLHGYSPIMVDIIAGMRTGDVNITATADPFLDRMGSFMFQHRSSTRSGVNLFKNAFPDAEEASIDYDGDGDTAPRIAMTRLINASMPSKSVSQRRVGDKTHEAANSCTGSNSTESHCSQVSGVNLDSGSAGHETRQADDAVSRRLSMGKPVFRSFIDVDDELRALAHQVQELVEGGLPPEEIAVVTFRGAIKAEDVVHTLHAVGVNARAVSPSPIFRQQTPRLLMSFLRCLTHPSESSPLLHLLMACPRYEAPEEELVSALETYLNRSTPLRSFLQDVCLDTGDGQGEYDISDRVREMFGLLLSDMDEFTRKLRRSGARELMSSFLKLTGQSDRLENPSTREEEADGLAVARLFEETSIIEQEVGNDNILLVEPQLRLSRKMQTSFYRRQSDDYVRSDFDESYSARAVLIIMDPMNVTSYSRAFHTVFIPGCSARTTPGHFNRSLMSIPQYFTGVAPSCNKDNFRKQDEAQRAGHIQRRRSSFYAAIGCARCNIIFSASGRGYLGKSILTPSPFLVEIFGSALPAKCVFNPDEKLSRASNVEVPDDKKIEKSPEIYEQSEQCAGHGSRELNLSHSSISAYQICPYQYYLQHVLHVTPPSSVHMAYGKAMHEAVALCLRAAEGEGNRNYPSQSLSTITTLFKKRFRSHYFPPNAHLRSLEARGAEGLKSFWERVGAKFAMADVSHGSQDGPLATAGNNDGGKKASRMLIERKFRVKVPESKIVLSGVFDKVDITPGTEAGGPAQRIELTDYKSLVTSKPIGTLAQRSQQLSIYSIAAERLFGVMPETVAIESIEDGRRSSARPDSTRLEEVLERINQVADAVRAKRFAPAPYPGKCSRCPFGNICHHSVAVNLDQ